MGNDYEGLINQVRFEICKGNMEVIAVVCKKEDKYCDKRDGFSVVTVSDLVNLDFDYIIVTSSKYFRNIKKEAAEIGINTSKLIDGTVLRIPGFDFGRYERLLSNPVTIISDDCWAGNVYNYLHLPFTSPFVNTMIPKPGYIKIMADPMYYLHSELKMVTEGNLETGQCTIGSLGEDDRKVELRFIHDANFQIAKAKWDRRVERINENNLLVKVGVTQEEIDKYPDWLEAFEKIEFPKIMFCYGLEANRVFTSNRFLWKRVGDRENEVILYYRFCDYMRENYMFDLDVFKLLCGESDYSRYN